MLINYVSIGKRIKNNRRQKKMTQESLAEQLEVSPEYISRIENAKAHANLEMMAKICSALNMNLEELICGVVVNSPEYINSQLAGLFLDIPDEKVDKLIAMLLLFREIIKD